MSLSSSPFGLLAALVLAVAAATCAYVGFMYGKEAGRCAERCHRTTATPDTARYYGGVCRCVVNGHEVRPL